jgi:hypothetical protein
MISMRALGCLDTRTRCIQDVGPLGAPSGPARATVMPGDAYPVSADSGRAP